jgi:type IV pilus assembly protein PilF
MTRVRVALHGVGALIVAGWMVGCTSTVTNTVVPVGDVSKDRITASDQPEASRRANVRLQLASAYFADGQLTTALDEVKQAIAADPKMGEAFNLRGLIYAGLGDDALAEDSFRRALQLSPRDGDAMHNYGWFLCLQKRYPEAATQFQQALAQPQYRDVTRTMLAQGVCEARAGQLIEAERTLLRAYALDSANPAIALNLSEVLFQRGEYERARFYIRRVNASPQQSTAQTLWLAARIEYRGGNARVANELGEQLLSRYPKSPEAASFQQGKLNE